MEVLGALFDGRSRPLEAARGVVDEHVEAAPTRDLLEERGDGVAVADADGDGLLDIVTTGVIRNRIYLNNGEGSFDDASEQTFLSLSPPASGPLFVDYDNDGDPDLFLATVGNQVLLENRLVPDGKWAFSDVSKRAGVDRKTIGFSAAAGDARPSRSISPR